ncbi:hypothetical protein MKS88_005703 [Plasmodium brasilianum]|uniref:Uncharacterized protein n=2 Tax=Plasmodium (Plasmodium) TaxID=418103 RepID=A0A1A8WIJ7_PLAMA|nr:conserved Plasmodium protein, unknown function [Plasmodium malariae]KAI4835020.1 hypothetical protein MKS88_005703 [Plasmodium brasilianum]SBS91068.1 conserved Plasmodium protein, unknown function [Plasmodium malariae]SCP03595.1 conserved Plasmodium protein, unknown function [Plasmodium malariae]
MLWKHFSRIPHELLGKGGLKKLALKVSVIKETFKIVLDLICRSYSTTILNKSTTKFINLYTKYIYNNVFAILCNNTYYKISNYKQPISNFFLRNKIINRKLERIKITTYEDKIIKKKGNAVKNKTNIYTEEIYENNPSEHYIIDLYNNETHLEPEYSSSFFLNNQISTCESNYNTTQSSDDSRTNENDDLYSSSYLENGMLSYETLEYDEDEANESIKNCYLYNGYTNATTYKNSEEYKFLKNRLNDKKRDFVNIAIDVSSQCYDHQGEDEQSESGSCNSSKREKNLENSDKEIKEIYKKKRRKKKRKIYEIYNTETTVEQNMYCANYLNEYYSSSYDCTSEESDNISRNDSADNDFHDNYSADVFENDCLCHYSAHSYDTIHST